jgi:hypothetical protein
MGSGSLAGNKPTAPYKRKKEALHETHIIDQ